MRKYLLLIIFAALLLSGCSQKKSGAAIEKNDEGQSKVAIQIDGAATPYYAPLYLAQEKGFFEEEGLDVEFYYASASEIVKNVAAGNVAFGFPNSDPVVMGRANGVPINIIHTTYQEGLGSIIFKEKSGIKEPRDLKGKTIGITSFGSPNYIQLQVILEKAGLSIKDVQIKIIGTGAIVNALVSDQVDAISFSMLRTYDLRGQGEKVNEFRSEEYMPTQGNVLVTSEAFRKNHKKECRAFIRALNKSLAYIVGGHIDEAVDMAIEGYAPGAAGNADRIKEVMNKEFAQSLWQSEATKKYGFGYSDLNRYDEYITLLQEYGLIETTYSADQLAYNLEVKTNDED